METSLKERKWGRKEVQISMGCLLNYFIIVDRKRSVYFWNDGFYWKSFCHYFRHACISINFLPRVIFFPDWTQVTIRNHLEFFKCSNTDNYRVRGQLQGSRILDIKSKDFHPFYICIADNGPGYIYNNYHQHWINLLFELLVWPTVEYTYFMPWLLIPQCSDSLSKFLIRH